MSATEKKLKFRVVYFSSEDPEYPASQLNTVHPSTKGWMSLRFCEFPQELGFEMMDGMVNFRQIQVLNHQSSIASKIEIFVGTGDDYETATFKRLGYMSIDHNERSNYQARELKTVFVDSYGKFIKLLLNENHHNPLNTFNQVGIIALNLTGLPTDHYDSGVKIQTPVAKLSGDRLPQSKAIQRNPYTDLSADINLDPHTANKLRLLADAKAQAIKTEDYLTAKQIKLVEQDLKQLGSRLAQLELAKTEAVAAEDYDLAKDIKDQCDDLKKDIQRKISAIEIPGVRLTTPATSRQPASRFALSKDDDNGYDDEIIVKKASHAPINVDELPVGGGGGGGGKKIAKVEAFHHPSFGEEGDGGGDSYDMQDDHYSLNSGPLDGDDRPIKPKPTVDYNDRDPTVEEEGSLGTGMPKENFPVGEHPLEGIPGFIDLPTPEPLSIKSREYCEQHGIIKLIGEYRARCLFSKSWNLREAVILKVEDLLKTEFMNDIVTATPALGAILKQGIEDKMQQVLFTSLNLLESILKAVKSGRVPKSIVVPAFDPTISQLIEKLADGNARQRESARSGLNAIAASSQVGPLAVSVHLVRALPPKQKTAWRPIAARLDVLAALVSTYHINSQSGLNMESMLNFAKTTQAFTHSHNEVRDNAKKLVVAIHKEVGTAPLEPTLALLRKKQREEYEAAFLSEAKGEGAVAGAAGIAQPKKSGNSNGIAAEKEKGSHNGSTPKRTDKSHQHATQNPGGKVPTSQAKVENQSQGYDDHHNHNNNHQQQQQQDQSNEEKPDFSSCMFCGITNKKWTENDLDLHYWKDCPLLISCPSCAQIVEIAGLPEHLLDECESKEDYVPCDITGLAIRKAEFPAWKKSPLCVPAPENFMYCPLCLSTVEDSDQAWLTHLTKKCAKNARIEGH